jgi:hypothetical protein
MPSIALRHRRGESGPHLVELPMVTPMLLLPALDHVPPSRRHLYSFRRFVFQ